MKMRGVYIPSIEAKDLYISNNYKEKNAVGYNIRQKDGELNRKKFKNVFDYSLDLIKLREIYERKYRRKDFAILYNGKQYSYQVINVTFKYAARQWNRLGQKYIMFGYDDKNLTYEDGTAMNESGEVVGVDTSVEVTHPKDLDYFECQDGHYKLVKDPPVIKTRAELREELYKNGFTCNGIHYVRMKRSAGSARVGKCLFVNEKLYKQMHKWELAGIEVKDGQEIDLAALESYISLSTSSIIGTIEIKPENILVIDDYDSVFKEKVIATQIVDGHLESKEQEIEISNSIWDGQSLMDISLFDKYYKKGMLLLRNMMFKSCCFNCNVQQWFRDNGITDISQLNGYTRASDISEVKLITTPNSIKYLKFGTVDQWLDNIEPMFGVVKYDKPTHYFDGRMVKTHYQLLNTLEMTYQEMEQFLAPSLDFIQKLKDNPAVVRYFIKYPYDKEVEDVEMATKNDVVYNLMCANDGFTKTKYYYDFLTDLIKSQYKELRNGHVLVNGNYSTMVGNPIEMLLSSIGKFDGTSQLGKGNIHSTRFEYGKTILGSRSPHITMGNILLATNTANMEIDKYMNFTNQIVAMNAIGENTLERLSGSDYDSDTLMITDNQILINAAKKNYHLFTTPTNLVESIKLKRKYTPEEQCDLDVKTSVNKIGEIVNLSQVLNSVYWDRIRHGMSHEELHDLYCDVSTLDVMSNLEIKLSSLGVQKCA